MGKYCPRQFSYAADVVPAGQTLHFFQVISQQKGWRKADKALLSFHQRDKGGSLLSRGVQYIMGGSRAQTNGGSNLNYKNKCFVYLSQLLTRWYIWYQESSFK